MKWIKDTKIARKMNKGKIKEYRLNQKTEGWEMLVDDSTKSNLTITVTNGTIINPYTATWDPTWNTPSFTTVGHFYVDQDTYSSKDENGDIIFAKKEVV